MSTIKVKNPTLAGLQITMPDGSPAVFDADGIAEVSESCGVHDIPGYEVISGTPRAVITARREVKPADGPKVVCICPPDLAGATVMCPDGHTEAVFDKNGQAVVPNTCGLDQIAGFTFMNLEGKPVQGDYKPPEEPATGGVLLGGQEPKPPAEPLKSQGTGKKGSKKMSKKGSKKSAAADAKAEGEAAKKAGKPSVEARTAAREDAQVTRTQVAQGRVAGQRRTQRYAWKPRGAQPRRGRRS
jgi:hypothetical protein